MSKTSTGTYTTDSDIPERNPVPLPERRRPSAPTRHESKQKEDTSDSEVDSVKSTRGSLSRSPIDRQTRSRSRSPPNIIGKFKSKSKKSVKKLKSKKSVKKSKSKKSVKKSKSKKSVKKLKSVKN